MSTVSGETEYGWDIHYTVEDTNYGVFYPKDPNEPILVDDKTKAQWEEFRENLMAEAYNIVKSTLKAEGLEEYADDYIMLHIDADYMETLPDDKKKVMDNLIENVVEPERLYEVVADLQYANKVEGIFDYWESISAEEIKEQFGSSDEESEEFA
jgi:hypothetical protein